MAIDINKIVEWYDDHKGKITYSMEGSRTGADGTADCSGAVVAALEFAGAPKPPYVYNTDSIHAWLLSLGFKLIAENQDWTAKKGDIVIWGRKGSSGSAYGHAMVMYTADPNAKEVSVDYSTGGAENTAVQVYDYDAYFEANDVMQDFGAVYVYRYSGSNATAASTVSGKTASTVPTKTLSGIYQINQIKLVAGIWQVINYKLAGGSPKDYNWVNNGIPMSLFSLTTSKGVKTFDQNNGKVGDYFKFDNPTFNITATDSASNGQFITHTTQDMGFWVSKSAK